MLLKGGETIGTYPLSFIKLKMWNVLHQCTLIKKLYDSAIFFIIFIYDSKICVDHVKIKYEILNDCYKIYM